MNFAHVLPFLLRHGYAVILISVLAEQLGLPLSAGLLLVAAGALAGMGRLSLAEILALALAAAMAGDLAWYELGRWRGHSILRLLCRISLEPDSCVRRTEDRFARQGGRVLLVTRFIPGLGAAAPPLAGLLGMGLGRFLAWDAAGALLWSGVYTLAGYLFSPQLDRLGRYGARLGTGLLALLAAALVLYVAWKYYQRQKFIRELRVARITPEELLEKMKAGENLVVVDLRGSLDFEADGSKVQGAIHMLPSEVETRWEEIPRDRDVVLYCT